MASGSGRPTAGRRRKYKSPATRAAEEAVDHLAAPILPELLRGDDGPSGDDEEKDAKRPRSTSTAPTSARGMDPDKYDRLMGTSSVNPSEGDRFGDGDVTDTEEMAEGVAHDSMTSTPIVSGSSNCPGADLDSRGYGSASVTECLNRNLTRVPSLAAPAEYFRSQPNPRQVMSPNSGQNLAQDPFDMQIPKPEADANVRTRNSPVRCKNEDASTASMPVKEELDVKDKPESGSAG